MKLELQELFELKEDGLYYKNNRRKAGSYDFNRKEVRIKISNIKFSEKDLVYYFHHGYWSDYQLINADGDPRNNGILNLLEEGETLVRLKDGRRYDPVTKKYFKRVYEDFTLKHHYEEVDG